MRVVGSCTVCCLNIFMSHGRQNQRCADIDLLKYLWVSVIILWIRIPFSTIMWIWIVRHGLKNSIGNYCIEYTWSYNACSLFISSVILIIHFYVLHTPHCHTSIWIQIPKSDIHTSLDRGSKTACDRTFIQFRKKIIWFGSQMIFESVWFAIIQCLELLVYCTRCSHV